MPVLLSILTGPIIVMLSIQKLSLESTFDVCKNSIYVRCTFNECVFYLFISDNSQEFKVFLCLICLFTADIFQGKYVAMTFVLGVEFCFCA